jgi:integrase
LEFKTGNAEHRQDRRICPKCERRCGPHKTCPGCGTTTRPRIRIVWFVGEERRRKLTNLWREEDAAAELKRIEADYWRLQELGVTREPGGSLKDAIKAFEKHKHDMSAHWRLQISKVLALVREQLGPDMPVTEVTREHLKAFLAEGLLERAPTSMRSYMLVVRCFFRWLAEEGWIRVDPARKIKLPRARSRYEDCLLPEQVGPVIAACRQVCPEFAPICMAIVLGSFRKGEVVNLRWQDIILDARWAFVLDYEGDDLTEAWSPKTESSRRAVPLHPLLARTLAGLERVRGPDGTLSPWVFPVTDARRKERLVDRRGRVHPVRGDRRSADTTWFGKCLRLALARARIKQRVTIHGLRRTFAVLLQDAGAPDSIIRQAMGHEPHGVTARHYLPRRDALVQRWVDRISVDGW